MAKEEEAEKQLSGRDKYLMNQNEFVRGKRLIDPVTGRVEGDNDDGEGNSSDESREQIEKRSVNSKRSKIMDQEIDMKSDSGSQMSV